MSEERLIFGDVVAALLVHGLADRMTPALRSQVVGLGLDVWGKPLPAYPAERFDQAILAARALFPELGEVEALRELGLRMSRSLHRVSWVAGMMPALRLIGVGRALRRIFSRTMGHNFASSRYAERGPTIGEVWFSFVALPEYAAGTVQGVVEIVGGREVRVAVADRAGEAATFRVEWA